MVDSLYHQLPPRLSLRIQSGYETTGGVFRLENSGQLGTHNPPRRSDQPSGRLICVVKFKKCGSVNIGAAMAGVAAAVVPALLEWLVVSVVLSVFLYNCGGTVLLQIGTAHQRI